MVLGDLGRSIASAFRNMSNSTVIDEKVLDDLLGEIVRALIQSDVNIKLVSKLRTNVKASIDLENLPAGVNRRTVIQSAVVKELTAMLDPEAKPYVPRKGKCNVFMTVGLQGSGKTTTCTKFANWYARKGWKVALVCADTFRAGAFDQLKKNATKAKIPFYGSYSERDPVALAREGVKKFKADKYEIIIVDTSGRHKQEAALFEEMDQIAKVVKPDEIVFVMDSTIGQQASAQARAFKEQVEIGACILTKLDGHAAGGGALSAVAETQAPIIFIGTGEGIEDLETFTPKAFVSRLLGLGDIPELMNVIKAAGINEKDQMALMENILKGVFTLRDLHDQFANLLKMGPLNQVMSMIPGFGNDLIPKGKEKEGKLRIKRFMTMMNSMTDAELDAPKLLTGPTAASRKARISRGSGRSIRDVDELLFEYKRMSKVIEKFKNMKLPKSGDPSKMNMAQMSQVMSQMNPAMMQQMGGAAGLQKMMKQMQQGGLGGLGGFPGM